jgi:hypothetical protein
MIALLIYPTHKNCREVEDEFKTVGIDAVTYPGRITRDSDEIPQNCWNTDADAAEAMGMPVIKTICPHCHCQIRCKATGYLGELAAVEKATVVLCTHKRAEFAGLANLSSGCTYVSIHENPISLLRPALSLSEQDLGQLQRVLNRVRKNPVFLDGSATPEVLLYQNEERAIRRERQFRFVSILADAIDTLAIAVQQAETTTEWRPPNTMKVPTGIEWKLFLATRLAKVTFQGPAWRFALSAAAGELKSIAILVSESRFNGGGQKAFDSKIVWGYRDNLPRIGASTWFNDATLAQDRLEPILGRPVHDMTPGGGIELQHKRVQILRDITYRTSEHAFASYLRGILADRPQFQRVGVICLRPHVRVVGTLGAEFSRRIVKATYFKSGDDRSSNDWHKRCDLIVVAGTPRVPPAAIATYLVQCSETEAARRQPNWGTVYWEGRTESGEAVRVESRGYQDRAWRKAHRDLVRSQLVQAVGRGRGILEAGCEVVLLSTEECGVAISDARLEPLNSTSSKVVETLRELSLTFPKESYLKKVSVSTREIALAVGFSEPQVRRVLAGLERRGLVQKIGERGGWAPVSPKSRRLSESSIRPTAVLHESTEDGRQELPADAVNRMEGPETNVPDLDDDF